MAPTLKSIIQLTGIAPGASPSSTHNLNVAGLAVVPDEVKLSNPEFTFVSADDTNVVVRNDGAGVGDCDVLVEHWHTVERAFGAAQTKELTPQPFNAAAGGGAAAAIFLGYFGDGSDGDSVLGSDLTLTRDMHFETLDTGGFDVFTKNFRLFCRTELIVRNGSRVHSDGADGVADAGGAFLAHQTVAGGGAGGAGTGAAGGATGNSLGGNGGAGGNGFGAGGAGGVATALVNGVTKPRQLPEAATLRTTGFGIGGGYDYMEGGGGGGGGDTNGIEPPGNRPGGGGGAGGNICMVSALAITIETSGVIGANGGDGADGPDPTADIGGGGGGGGGALSLVYHTLVNNGTLEALGGAGGLGRGTGTNGAAGSVGSVYQLEV
jgi:hypothetical protein